jgi:hypothetical protein
MQAVKWIIAAVGEAIRVLSETLLDFRFNELVLLPATH